VRHKLLQSGAFLLLLVCLCGHVAETFDFWDRTLQTDSDIEYSVVIVALVAGADFGLAHAAATVMRTVSLMSCLSCSFVPSPFAYPRRSQALVIPLPSLSEFDSLSFDTGLARLIHPFCSIEIEGGHVFVSRYSFHNTVVLDS
jgi:hypothetical protein